MPGDVETKETPEKQQRGGREGPMKLLFGLQGAQGSYQANEEGENKSADNSTEASAKFPLGLP